MLDSVLVSGASSNSSGVSLELPFNFYLDFLTFSILNKAGVGLGVGDRCWFRIIRCLS